MQCAIWASLICMIKVQVFIKPNWLNRKATSELQVDHILYSYSVKCTPYVSEEIFVYIVNDIGFTIDKIVRYTHSRIFFVQNPKRTNSIANNNIVMQVWVNC